MASKDTSRWYAVRAKPGSQRQAKAMVLSEDATEMFKLEIERRKNESIIERQLRNENIDVYMPSYTIEMKHHRTNEIFERRLPLLVGYVFVHLPAFEFERVRKVESVMCMLAPSRDAGPVRFPETTIAKLMLLEFDARQRHKFETETKAEEVRFKKAEHLRGQLKKILPKGRARTVNMREWADYVIDRLNDGAKEKVRGIIKELDALYPDNAVAQIDKVA